ncbi:MAG TPA: hypothetical protein VLZ07_04840, partial [Syntrophales bacterium]|nr:hypothetical protein [Syntrophales bacterium]
MSRSKSIALGIFTCWPIVYFFAFFGVVASQFFFFTMKPSPSNEMPIIFKILFPLHFFTMVEIIVLLIIYISYLFKTERVPSDK